MPTYTYECKKCHANFDVFHGMLETPRIKCEDCGGVAKKLIGTGAGIIFKGSGFYETDFKDKKGTPPSESKSESKTESKSSNGNGNGKSNGTKKDSKASNANKS